MRPTKNMSQHDMMRALTASILFASFESLSGNTEGATPHVVHSRRLLEQYKSNAFKGPETLPVDLDIIEPLVAHYEVQVGGYISGSDAEGIAFDPNGDIEFSKLADARVLLEKAIANLSVVCWRLYEHYSAEDVAAISAEKARYSAWLERWDKALSTLLAEHSTVFDRETMDGCRLLKAHQTAASIFADVDYMQGETGWTAFIPRFRIIVDLITVMIDNLPKRRLSAQAPQVAYLSSTMGMTEPLYLTATRCPDHVIAQKARTLMKKLPLSEGVHSAWRTSFIEKTLCAVTGRFHSSQITSSSSTPLTRGGA